MDVWLWIILAIVLIIVVLLATLAVLRNERRRKQIRAALEQMGYVVTDVQMDLDLEPFAISRLGDQGVIDWRGLRFQVDDALVTIFDYMATSWVGRGRDRRMTKADRQTVLLFESERLDLPAFSLRPETLGAKIRTALGQQDIDFDQHPDFSSAYVLHGPDESQIRALFTDEKLDFFAHTRGLCVEGLGQKLLCYRPKKVISAKEFNDFLKEGLAVLYLLTK